MDRVPRFFSPLVVVLALGAAGCATDKVTGRTKFSLVDWSVEEELALGREMSPIVEAQYDSVLIDREAHRYLGALVAEMGAESVRADELDFTFEILDSSVPNAFALPGGRVYITRGLLAALENEGQFISVVGHELGHVEHQHAMFSQSRGTIAGFPGRTLGSIGAALPIGGGVVSSAGGLLSLGPSLITLKYDRDQELEADDRGVYFAAALGYDPRDGLATFELFQRLEAEAGGSQGLSIFSTHPQNQDRIDHMQATIAREYGDARAAGSRTGERFAAIVVRMRANAPAYALYDQAYAELARADEDALARAEEQLGRAHELVPDEPLFLIGLGELAVIRQAWEEAWTSFSQAVALYEGYSPTKGHWKPFFYLGLLSLAAEDAEAGVRYLRSAAARCWAIAELQFLLGVAEEASGDVERAKAAYEKVRELAPSDSGIYREARTRARAL